MLAELRLALITEKAQDINWITFVGSGAGGVRAEAVEEPFEAAEAIILRRLMSNEDPEGALSRWGVYDPATTMRIFAESGRCVRVERYGKAFWRAP